VPNELMCGITFVFLALLAFAVCFFPIPSRKKVRPLGRDKELLEENCHQARLISVVGSHIDEKV